MQVVKAEFDGQVFVPCQPIELPVGAKVEVLIPPPKPTEEESASWQEILNQLKGSQPPFATFDEYLRYRRMQPF